MVLQVVPLLSQGEGEEEVPEFAQLPVRLAWQQFSKRLFVDAPEDERIFGQLNETPGSCITVFLIKSSFDPPKEGQGKGV